MKSILPPRTPGVGAEVDKLSDLASINLGICIIYNIIYTLYFLNGLYKMNYLEIIYV